jgi:hypothetical protein
VLEIGLLVTVTKWSLKRKSRERVEIQGALFREAVKHHIIPGVIKLVI